MWHWLTRCDSRTWKQNPNIQLIPPVSLYPNNGSPTNKICASWSPNSYSYSTNTTRVKPLRNVLTFNGFLKIQCIQLCTWKNCVDSSRNPYKNVNRCTVTIFLLKDWSPHAIISTGTTLWKDWVRCHANSHMICIFRISNNTCDRVVHDHSISCEQPKSWFLYSGEVQMARSAGFRCFWIHWYPSEVFMSAPCPPCHQLCGLDDGASCFRAAPAISYSFHTKNPHMTIGEVSVWVFSPKPHLLKKMCKDLVACCCCTRLSGDTWAVI